MDDDKRADLLARSPTDCEKPDSSSDEVQRSENQTSLASFELLPSACLLTICEFAGLEAAGRVLCTSKALRAFPEEIFDGGQEEQEPVALRFLRREIDALRVRVRDIVDRFPRFASDAPPDDRANVKKLLMSLHKRAKGQLLVMYELLAGSRNSTRSAPEHQAESSSPFRQIADYRGLCSAHKLSAIRTLSARLEQYGERAGALIAFAELSKCLASSVYLDICRDQASVPAWAGRGRLRRRQRAVYDWVALEFEPPRPPAPIYDEDSTALRLAQCRNLSWGSPPRRDAGARGEGSIVRHELTEEERTERIVNDAVNWRMNRAGGQARGGTGTALEEERQRVSERIRWLLREDPRF